MNYLILKAKEEVNEVFKVLFAKDSKFNQLRSSKRTVSNEDQDVESVKIGSVKLAGHIPLLGEKKELILSQNQVKGI